VNDKYEVVSSEVKFRGQIIITKVEMVRMPDGSIHEREFVEHQGAVGIVPVTDDGEVILVKQYRHPTKGDLLEIPAGKLRSGEDPYMCAGRELIEETGFTGNLDKIAEFYTTPGYSNEYFHLFMATGLEETGHKPSDEEITELVTVSISAAIEMIRTAEIRDSKTINGLCLAQSYLSTRLGRQGRE
jgi:ADP-ribose pyrophosphatase